MGLIRLCPFCGRVLDRDSLTGELTCPKECGSQTDYVIKALREKKARQEQSKKAG